MIFYLRKFLEFIFTLFLISLVTFATFQILPGNPAESILGVDADEAQIAALEKELGLDKNLAVRYGEWLLGIASGDFGKSYKYNLPVSRLIAKSAGVTAELSVFALVLTCLLGLAAGIFIALKERNPFAFFISVLNQIWISMPSFCAAVLLIIVFAVRLRVFPSMGYVSFFKSPAAGIRSLFLPALSLALASGAILSRYLKNSILTEQKKDYVRTLRAKGLSGRRIVFSHTLRNSLIPVLTTFGMIVTEILGGSIIIENVFALPGLGRLIATSISSRDFPLIQSLVLYLAFITVLCNFVIDILYSLIDPRIRRGGAQGGVK